MPRSRQRLRAPTRGGVDGAGRAGVLAVLACWPCTGCQGGPRKGHITIKLKAQAQRPPLCATSARRHSVNSSLPKRQANGRPPTVCIALSPDPSPSDFHSHRLPTAGALPASPSLSRQPRHRRRRPSTQPAPKNAWPPPASAKHGTHATAPPRRVKLFTPASLGIPQHHPMRLPSDVDVNVNTGSLPLLINRSGNRLAPMSRPESTAFRTQPVVAFALAATSIPIRPCASSMLIRPCAWPSCHLDCNSSTRM
ncbi:hypothetical protein PMIN06_003824 [Paraphaeosphaeria minitans]|uniref:Uncharacterized protein n=1 Tax=Paraphaeosphaeria minitans TaxID=565426 RepID=A0A9P6KRI6_9PLEO|nr:hypothetical protein PMIN01_06110 [Paraphaeosphaeria minitans]